MTDASANRADGTRRQILRAASREFARRPYPMVSLEDIITNAGLTKGGLYFYFHSKGALAAAIIDEQLEVVRDWLFHRREGRLSGLETLIESGYFIAAQDIQSSDVRAALNLLEQIGRSGGLHEKVFGEWSSALTAMAARGIADGDIVEGTDPEELCRLVMSIYMGLRQTVDLNVADELLSSLEHAWLLLLPGCVNADRLGYFVQFVKRRTAVAKGNASRPKRS